MNRVLRLVLSIVVILIAPQPLSGADFNWPLVAIEQPPTEPGVAITVAVIDSGLDYQHPDIARSNIWMNETEIANGRDDDGNGYVDDLMGWDFVDNDNNPWDNYGHGTFVTGIIAATRDNNMGIDGVTNNVRIMPLRILNNAGYGGQMAFARAMLYAIANGARVINLSFGTRAVSALDQMLIEYAATQDVTVVVAAGNLGIDVAEFGPSNVATAIVVGAVDSNFAHSAFSNSGALLDVVAPGKAIVSLRARQTDFNLVSRVPGYVRGSGFRDAAAQTYQSTGTSFAAPFVTGLAAELLAQMPSLTTHDLQRIIVQSAADVNTPGIDLTSGYGLINIEAALNADPNYFVDAAISGVEIAQTASGIGVRILGKADADQFRNARLSIGAGIDPGKWITVSGKVEQTTATGELSIVPAQRLQGSNTWTLKLEVFHRNKRMRESRYVMNVD